MSLLPPTFNDSLFDIIDEARSSVRRNFTTFIEELHEFLNELPCMRDIQEVRGRIMGIHPRYPQAFGAYTIERGHWYTYNHGGRNEMQFNIGMFGPSFINPPYVRVGLAWNIYGPPRRIVDNSLESFRNLITTQRRSWDAFVKTNGLEIEWVRRVGVDDIEHTQTSDVTEWLLHPQFPHYDWIFIGRLLRRSIDGATLTNPNQIKHTTEAVFSGFRPFWEQTQRMAQLTDAQL